VLSLAQSFGMTADSYWPLPGLRLRTSQLELRVPDEADLIALARLAEAGVHDPATQPFAVPWTDAAPVDRALSTMRYHWSCWGSWEPANWTLNLVAVSDSAVVGTIGLSARDFAVMREVGTGSWLGLAYQGRGFGTQMRAAVLALAFDGLGARFAKSSAFTFNAASLAVSARLGYADDGTDWRLIRGEPAEIRRLRLHRESWLAHRDIEVGISGLEPCLPFFGID
jgi:RimJ/RimL family protein N-acetyltransferase